MNKTVFGITYLICVNTLGEFTMINGNTMNTTAHNNDLQLIKHCQYFIHPSSTTCKKFNETFLNKPWGKRRADQATHTVSRERSLSSIINRLLWHPWKAAGAVRGLHEEIGLLKGSGDIRLPQKDAAFLNLGERKDKTSSKLITFDFWIGRNNTAKQYQKISSNLSQIWDWNTLASKLVYI